MPQQYFRGIRIPDYDEMYPLPLVPKSEWGALPPTGDIKQSTKLFHTIVFAFNTNQPTCTSHVECTRAVQELQKRDLQLGYPDICYNFILGGDGRVYEGRGWRGDQPLIYPTKYKRSLLVGIIGQGKDRYKTWLPPFDELVRKLIRDGIDVQSVLKRKHTLEEDRKEVFEAAYIDFVKRHYDPDQFGETKLSRKKKYLKTFFDHLPPVGNDQDANPADATDWDGEYTPDPKKLKEMDDWVVTYSDIDP